MTETERLERNRRLIEKVREKARVQCPTETDIAELRLLESQLLAAKKELDDLDLAIKPFIEPGNVCDIQDGGMCGTCWSSAVETLTRPQLDHLVQVHGPARLAAESKGFDFRR